MAPFCVAVRLQRTVEAGPVSNPPWSFETHLSRRTVVYNGLPRLTEPMVRENDVLRLATWDEALDRAAN